MRGWVYFFRAEGLDLIKIGWTTRSPSERYSELDMFSPVPLCSLGYIECEQSGLEKQLHREFKDLWHRGEWFRSDPRLLGYIAKNARSWFGLRRDSEIRADTIDKSNPLRFSIDSTTRCDRCRRVIWAGVERFAIENKPGDSDLVCADCIGDARPQDDESLSEGTALVEQTPVPEKSKVPRERRPPRRSPRMIDDLLRKAGMLKADESSVP
jgi:hypothetical protein